MKKIIQYILLTLILILISGCTLFAPTKPHFVDEYVKAEPSYLRPNYAQQNQLTLHYIIKNPLNYDFPGKVSYKYKSACLVLDSEETPIIISMRGDNSSSISVGVSNIRNFAEECYGVQNILLVLSNTAGTVIYDSQNVEISVIR